MSKLIGQGSYGCVVTPPISKSEILIEYLKYTNKKKTDVAKLFITDGSEDGNSDFLTEYKLFNEITKKIDPEHKFTVEMKGAYKSKNKKLSDKIYNCVNDNTYYEIIFENGGTELYDIKKKICLCKFLKKFEVLINGLQILHKNKILHRDIKPNNILINNKKISLIDFGLSIYKKDTYNSENIHFLTHNSPFYPPEFMVMYHVLKKRQDILKKCKDDYENINNDFSIFQNLEAYEKYENGSINKEKRFKELKEFLFNNKNYVKNIKENVEKVDVYSIGITLLVIEDKIQFKNEKEKEIYNILIEKCINFNILKRFNCNDILNYINLNKKQTKVIKDIDIQIIKKQLTKNINDMLLTIKLDKKQQIDNLKHILKQIKSIKNV